MTPTRFTWGRGLANGTGTGVVIGLPLSRVGRRRGCCGALDLRATPVQGNHAVPQYRSGR